MFIIYQFYVITHKYFGDILLKGSHTSSVSESSLAYCLGCGGILKFTDVQFGLFLLMK